MDIFVLLLIAILVYLLPENNNYLGVKSTSGLKGFLALGIVFHHLSQWVTTGVEFSNFGYMEHISYLCFSLYQVMDCMFRMIEKKTILIIFYLKDCRRF